MSGKVPGSEPLIGPSQQTMNYTYEQVRFIKMGRHTISTYGLSGLATDEKHCCGWFCCCPSIVATYSMPAVHTVKYAYECCDTEAVETDLKEAQQELRKINAVKERSLRQN